MVESIGDMLALWDCGIKNILVVFGLNLSPKMISLLIKADPRIVYIAFNNDSLDNSAGNEAAEKVRNKISKYFDINQVKLALPNKNDFGEMNKEEILGWKKQYGVS